MKKQSGITLVALVITIVILLILAGISISALTNQGLFAQAENAKKTTENAQIEEKEKLGDYENKIEQYIDGNRNLSQEDYERILNMLYPNKTLDISDFTDTTTEQTYTIPCSGWLYLRAGRNNTSYGLKCYRNDAEILAVNGIVDIGGYPTGFNSIYIPVKKGDVIRKTQNNTGFSIYVRLDYYEE